MIIAERRQAALTVVGFECPRLDVGGARSFRDGVRHFTDGADGAARRISVDLDIVDFTGSTGLAALVGCLEPMGEGGTIERRRPGVRIHGLRGAGQQGAGQERAKQSGAEDAGADLGVGGAAR